MRKAKRTEITVPHSNPALSPTHGSGVSKSIKGNLGDGIRAGEYGNGINLRDDQKGIPTLYGPIRCFPDQK
jgi:hypothetical protein